MVSYNLGSESPKSLPTLISRRRVDDGRWHELTVTRYIFYITIEKFKLILLLLRNVSTLSSPTRTATFIKYFNLFSYLNPLCS